MYSNHNYLNTNSLTTPSINKLNIPKQKGFTLIELLIVIAVIGILASIALVGFKGVREKAYSARGKANRKTANVYCLSNPGSSTITAANKNGVTYDYEVYCDKYGNMWSETLNDGGTVKTYAWAEDEEKYKDKNVMDYTYGGINDCNEVKLELIEHFPACNACATLDYAGFHEGWRLPAQTPMRYTGTCNTAICGRGDPDPGSYCAPGRQLWDFGAEQCPVWGTEDNTYNCKKSYNISADDCCGNKIKADWDLYSVANTYWSASQQSGASAWYVNFVSANITTTLKNKTHYVRCFLGHW